MFSASAPRWLRAALIALALVAGLPGCGFKLAGSAALPQTLQQIQLVTRNFDDAQRELLQRRLDRAGASLAPPGSAVPSLSVTYQSIPDRDLVTSASTGKTVRRIARGIQFTLKSADGETLISRRLQQQRDITEDEDNLLASTEERAAVIRDLDLALFNQLIHQLRRI